MEESFRNSLIIISAIVIGAIFVHGLWTIRKNKNPYKLKTNLKDIEAQEKRLRDFDRSGFDQDGVSKVKVKPIDISDDNNSDLTKDDLDFNKDDFDLNNDRDLDDHNSTNEDQSLTDISSATINFDNEITEDQKNVSNSSDFEATELDFNLDVSVVEQEGLHLVADAPEPEIISVYNDPVSKPKPKLKETIKKSVKKISKQELKRDQMEINFGDSNAIGNDDANISPVKVSIEPEVLSISVIVPQGQIISGAALLPSLLTLGMKYGEMDVFHRHQDNAGNGKVTFSLVNAMNPGTFDLDNMETFVTQGVSLFMTLPNAGDPFEVFEQMLVAAKQLASEFKGQLLDDKRSVLTKQTEQHYVTKIREFERKSRLASL
ncbi:MAG: cell division protein ZipA [Gammaproteobacteria bacterium]|nr:MAG: cell division protein ZipA [Gammaproteobacteria bacterium]